MKKDSIEITKLNNGVTIITDNENFEQVSTGIWVKTGLLNETFNNNGISHVIEHMCFQGTKNRNTKQLAEYIENLGGCSNAYTAMDHTAYIVNTIPKYIKEALEYLTDIVVNPIFPEKELELEKKVICEEIGMGMDDINTCFYSTLYKNLYPNTIQGNKVIGSIENVKKFTSEDLIKYHNENYVTNNIVVSICGKVNHKKIVKFLEHKFDTLNTNNVIKQDFDTFTSFEKRIKSKFNQTMIGLFYDGLNRNSEDIYTYYVWQNIIDGGFSGRLFNTMRNKYGLVYSVNQISCSYEKNGILGIVANTNKDNIEKVEKAIKDVLESMLNIEDSELIKAKNLVLTALAQTMDSCDTRRNINAESILYDCSEDRNFELIKSKVSCVTKEQLLDFYNKYFNNKQYTTFIME